MKNMTNDEVTNAYAKIFTDLESGKITIKESKTKVKEFDYHLKWLHNSLKWLKIAIYRNELTTLIYDGETVLCIPASSLLFYPGLENYQDFNITINEIEYCVIDRH